MPEFKLGKDGSKSLPDTAILKLIETAMEEMLLFEAKNRRNLDTLTSHPLSEGKILRAQLKNFLLTQYGLPSLADQYMS